ncbi:hypothetical protein SK128_019338 [Halocaridina rubra]|uniref:Uncharacterized protein n=1 Tax=Halocaridina rubra TaxID=373956 RepID=A0AAN8WWL9_HALRR
MSVIRGTATFLKSQLKPARWPQLNQIEAETSGYHHIRASSPLLSPALEQGKLIKKEGNTNYTGKKSLSEFMTGKAWTNQEINPLRTQIT